MASPQTSTSTPGPAPAAAASAAAGEATELDRLLALERSKESARAYALEPNDFVAAERFATMVVNSGMFVNKDGEKPTVGSIMLRLMTGRNLGIPVAIALQHVYDVYGRTGISAALKRTLVRRHPECERFEMLASESDDTHCVWVVKRKGNAEKRFTFTLADAERAGLVKPDSNWKKWPRRMLQARASSEAADVEFADACMGLSTIEEILELDREPMAPPVGAAAGASSTSSSPTPTRDWAKESAEVTAKVLAMVADGKGKQARELAQLFEQDAPESYSLALKQAYNDAIAAAKKKGEEKPKAPPAGATTGQQTLGRPASEYVPPNKRGDSYDGPDQPPPGWKP